MRERTTSSFLECECDCGKSKEVIVTLDHLKRELIKSCGCLQDGNEKENQWIIEGTSDTKCDERINFNKKKAKEELYGNFLK